jgi:hypothetical protein
MTNNLQRFLGISVLFVFILGVSSIPSSYADHTNVNVNIAKGSSVSGCEEKNE